VQISNSRYMLLKMSTAGCTNDHAPQLFAIAHNGPALRSVLILTRHWYKENDVSAWVSARSACSYSNWPADSDRGLAKR